MSDYDLATIGSALSQNIKDMVPQAFNRRARLLELLRVEPGEGKNVAVDIELDGANGENYSDGADVSAYGSDTPSIATQNWGLYRSNFRITDLAANAAGTSRSPAQLTRVLGRNTMNAVTKLASVINGAGYSGAGTGSLIAGLSVGVDDDNTYMGINRASVAGWRAYVIDPGSSTDPTIAQIRTDIGTIGDQCGEAPNIGLAPTAVWNKLAALFQEFRRINQSTDGSQPAVMSASVNAIEIDGCYIYKDKDATANQIQYLNSNYVYWESLPFVNDGSYEWFTDFELAPGLTARLVMLARTGAARKFSLMVQLQLVVSNPLTCGVRRNVAT